MKKASSKPAKDQIVYPIVNVLPYFDRKYNEKALGSLTADKAKELLGWREESENIKFKRDYLFTDRGGNKVRCNNNLHNRPFNQSMSQAYMLEILRGKWRLNGESCIIDNTAMVQDSQHRLVALVWANQEWLKHPDKWARYWETEPVLDTIIVTGISNDDTTINTINTGKRRSLSDVMYRSGYFRDLDSGRRRQAAKVAEWAVRTVWFRTGQAALSNAPRMPHSEACDFLERHLKLLESVRLILSIDGKAGNIRGYLPPGQAAGLHYLMAACNTDRSYYEKVDSEDGIDMSCWEQSTEFWNLVAKKSKKVEPLLEALLDIPEDAGGGYVRNLRYGSTINAWNLFVAGNKITKDEVQLKKGRDAHGRPIIIESPVCGGVDIGGDVTLIDQEEEIEDEDE